MHFQHREIESDLSEHVRNFTPPVGYSFRGLRVGDVIKIDGVSKTIVAKRCERFSIICVFEDGTEMDRLDIYERMQ